MASQASREILTSDVFLGFDHHLHPKIYTKRENTSRVKNLQEVAKLAARRSDESNSIIAHCCVKYRNGVGGKSRVNLIGVPDGPRYLSV